MSEAKGGKTAFFSCIFFTHEEERKKEKRTEYDNKEESKQCECIKGRNEDGDGSRDGSMRRAE